MGINVRLYHAPKKNKMKIFWTIIIVGLASCTQVKTVGESNVSNNLDDQVLYEMAATYLFPLPENAADEAHPISKELVELGRALYEEKALSLDETVSCNSCHPLDSFGVNATAYSEGVGGQLGARNSPTTFNAAFHLAQFWDGRAKDVEAQVEGPLFNPVEMAMPSKKAVVGRLQSMPKYVSLFAQAYPESEEMNFAQVARALGAFERTLVTPSRLDDYLKGDLAILSEKEKRGLKNMLDYGCIPCHSGSTMGGAMYQKFGLFADYRQFTGSKKGDYGKYLVTKLEKDEDVFKVPSLRNITKTAPYFHDGSVEKLEDAVIIMSKLQLGRELTEDEVADIVAFLGVSADWKVSNKKYLGVN